jgi:PAS domain S-box-containing protein
MARLQPPAKRGLFFALFSMPMKKKKIDPLPGPLRVLLLEDNPTDAELVLRELRRAKLTFTSRLVEGKREFSKALAEFQPQVILSDFKLPRFDGLAALEMTRLRAPDIPFIFVSGSIGEEKAIETLAQGAADYVLKDNMARLGPAVKQALATAALQKQKIETENSLRASEEKYRTLVTQSPDGIFIMNMEGAFLSVNKAICEGLKYSETEFLSLKIWDIVPEQYVDLHIKRLADILKGEAKNEAAEYQVRGKDGEMHYVSILSAPYYRDGKIIGFQGIARDITEQKKMEIRLRESEEYYRTLVETSPDAIAIVDAGGRVTFVSSKAYELFDVPAKTTLLGTQILDFVENDEIPRVQGRMVEILSGQSRPEIREYRLRKHDGRPFWGEVSSAPLRDTQGRGTGLLLVCRDISERKRAEEELRRNEERFRLLFEGSPTGVFQYDDQCHITECNHRFVEILQSSRDQLIGLDMNLLKDQSVLPCIRQALAGEEGIYEGIYRATTSSAKVWVSMHTTPLFDSNGQVSGGMGIVQDISERKRAEEELRISAEKWQTTFDSITDIVCVISMDHTFLEINKAGCDSLGLARKDIIGKNCYELVHNLHQPLAGCPCSMTIKSKKMEVNEVFERGRYYQLTAWPILDAQGELIAFSHVVKDITEHKRAEEALSQSEDKFRKIFENHSAVKLLLDPDNGAIINANHAATQYYGWTREELKRMRIQQINTLSPEQIKVEMEKVRTQKRIRFEFRHRRADGSIRDVEVFSSKIEIEGKDFLHSIVHDITERKQAEMIQTIHYNIANAMVTTENLNDLFDIVRRELGSLLDTTNFVIAFYDQGSNMLTAPFVHDEKDDISQWPAEKSLTGLVIKKRKSLLLDKEQIRHLAKADEIELIGSQAESWLGVPLQIGDKVLGAIVVQSYDNAKAFDENSVTVLEIIANQLSVYIEHNWAEESLRKSEEKYRTLVENANDIIYRTDALGRFNFLNSAALKVSGQAEADLIGKHFSEVIRPDCRAEARRFYVRQFVKKIPSTYYEFPMQTRDKGEVWLGQQIQLIIDNDQVVGFNAIARDITERKQAEEQIQYQASLLQNVSDAIIATDKNSEIQMWNQAAETTYGWKTEEVIGKDLRDVINPEYRYQRREEVFETMKKTGVWSGEIIHRHRDGRQILIQSNITILKDAAGDPAGMVSVNHDASERKRADLLQNAVYQVSQAADKAVTLADLFLSIHAIISDVMPAKNFYIALYDDETNLLSVPYFIDEVDAAPPPSTFGKGLTEYVIRTGKPLLCDAATDREMQQRGEVEMIGIPAAIWAGVPLIVENKTIGAMVVQHYSNPNAYGQRELRMLEYVSAQVAKSTWRKRAEAEILRQKAFLEKLVEAAPEGIAITDCPGRVLQVNSEFVRMFGYAADEIVGTMIDDLVVPPEHLEEAGTITHSTGAGKTNSIETLRKRKDGTLINVSIIGAPIFIAERQVAVYAIYRDISERKLAEVKLAEQLDELRRWQDVMLDREDRVQKIKHEINELCHRLGEPVRYSSQEGSGTSDPSPIKGGEL